MNAERRMPYEIYWEILVFCKPPRSFTSIFHRCTLNSKTGQDYIGFLTERGISPGELTGRRPPGLPLRLPVKTPPSLPGCIRHCSILHRLQAVIPGIGRPDLGHPT